MLHLKKWLKTRCWKSTLCSHYWLTQEMPILLMLPLAHAAFRRQAPKHYSSATFTCVCNHSHNSKMQCFHSPLECIALSGAAWQSYEDTTHFLSSLNNCMLISGRYSPSFPLCPGLDLLFSTHSE